MKIPFRKIIAAEFKNRSFTQSLHAILKMAKKRKSVKIGEIFQALAGKGNAALLVIFSLPFCFPIQIPGFSTIFGIIIGFLGLRIAFGKRLWWPKWVLERSISSAQLESLVKKTIKTMQIMNKFLRPRLMILTQSTFLHRMHGILVVILAIFLSLPLPIPFTNVLSAVPLVFIGLGLLEEDGVFILLGYLFALLCFGVFLGIFLLSKSALNY